jgi:hypothetical protein
MKTLHIAVVAATLLLAGAARAANLPQPTTEEGARSAAALVNGAPYLDLTRCTDAQKQTLDASAQRALFVPDRDRGQVVTAAACPSAPSAPAPSALDTRNRQ